MSWGIDSHIDASRRNAVGKRGYEHGNVHENSEMKTYSVVTRVYWHVVTRESVRYQSDFPTMQYMKVHVEYEYILQLEAAAAAVESHKSRPH